MARGGKGNKSIYDILVENKLCSETVMNTVKQYAESLNCSVGKALIDNGCLDEDNTLKLLQSYHNIRAVKSIETVELDESILKKFDNDTILDLKFLPYKSIKKDNTTALEVFIVSPSSSLTIEDKIKSVLKITGNNVSFKYYLVLEKEFDKCAEKYDIKRSDENISDILNNIVVLKGVDSLTESEYSTDSSADDSVLIKAVNNILIDAYKKKASDIHIEPLENNLRVRFRIDGILIEQLLIGKNMYRQFVNRIKVMSNMDVNNFKTPQSGKLRIIHEMKKIDFRVSTLPEIYGEKITMRILTNDSSQINLDTIFYDKEALRRLRSLLSKPNGIILATGPTGSGKSSTLFASLSELNTVEKCIVTIEDPVEYRLAGVIQVNVNNDAGLNFASVLRETLRQDPDIIMVGEIRDAETARIAISASNTGHLVLSTLHTNDASSSVVRLTEMGVEPFMVSSALIGVISQRLVRKNCSFCSEEHYLEKDSIYRKLLDEGIRDSEIKLVRGRGCDKCNHTGFKGRVCLMELLVVDEAIQDAVVHGKSALDIKHLAIAGGMVDIRKDGINKVLQGLTTFDEVHKTIHFDGID